MKIYFFLAFSLFLFASSCTSHKRLYREIESLHEEGPKESWIKLPPELWEKNYFGTNTDSEIQLPETDLEKENIGLKKNVSGLFDAWSLRDNISDGRGIKYADITRECKGLIELDYAPNPLEWQNPQLRREYYAKVEKLIEEVGMKLLRDLGAGFDATESDFFISLLKTLAWQESSWQHYLRYKNWFFVIISPNLQNPLGDWGITQVARSALDAGNLLNREFFERKGYCSIYSSIYYGFLEFFYCYKSARDMPCNDEDEVDTALGAYNRYVSGFSSCHDRFSLSDEKFANFQIKAVLEFSNTLRKKPWEKYR